MRGVSTIAVYSMRRIEVCPIFLSQTQVRAATGHATAVRNRKIVVVDEEPHAGRHVADECDRLLVDPHKNAELVVEGGVM